MNDPARQTVFVPTEFFNPDNCPTPLTECWLVGPSAPKIEDGFDLHEGCHIVERKGDGKQINCCSDFFFSKGL